MNVLDIIGIIFLVIFALTCIIIAVSIGVWWYIGSGAMASLLAAAVYEEGKNDQ